MLLPKPIKKMIAVFRGGLSPQLIILSVCLGCTFGITPGWTGIHTFIVILFLLLNIHTGLFLISASLAKTLCFAAAPLMYHLGIAAQSHLGWIYVLLSKIPIVGLTDFTRYSVAAAVIAGPVVGIIAGIGFTKLVGKFRDRWLKLQEGSEAYQKWTAKKWVKVLDRILIGKKTRDLRTVMESSCPFFRKAGLAFASITVAVIVVAGLMIGGDTAGNYTRQALTKANGAEVNIADFSLSPLTGSVSTGGIEMTNPEKPQQNQLSIDKLSAKAGVYDLLCGRVVIDKVHIDNVAFDTPRETPGKIVETKTRNGDGKFDPSSVDIDGEDVTRLEKYFKNAKKLKATIEKIIRHLPDSSERSAQTKDALPESYLQYLSAKSPITTAARIIAKTISLDNVKLPGEQFGLSNIKLTNFSDAPVALGKPIGIEIASDENGRLLNMALDFAKDGAAKIDGKFENLDLAIIQSRMKSSNGMLFEKGLADGKFTGTVSRSFVDLTIDLKLKDLSARSGGSGLFGLDAKTTAQIFETIDNLETQIRIVGPAGEPSVAFDVKGLNDQFAKTLKEAGKKRLESELQKQIDKNLGDKAPEGIKKVISEPGKLLKGLGGLLGEKKEP